MYAPGGSLGLGKPFCAISISFLRIFSISPIVMANVRNKKFPRGAFSFFPRCPPDFGVV